MTTYRVDAATGHLSVSTRQDAPGAQSLASNPAAGLVYVATGSASCPGAETNGGREGAAVESYFVGRVDGRLTPVAEQTSPVSATSAALGRGTCGWEWLSAGPRWILGMWTHVSYGHAWHQLIAHGAGDRGEIERGVLLHESQEPPSEDVAPDPPSGILYQVRREDAGLTPRRWEVTAEAVRADRLTPAGSAVNCDSLQPFAFPLRWRVVTGGDLMIASAVGSQPASAVVCSYHAPDLTPLDVEHVEEAAGFPRPDLDSVELAAALHPAAARRGLLALSVAGSTGPGGGLVAADIGLFSVRPDGNVSFLRKSPVTPPTQLAFDPTGRFLYAADASDLRVYSIDDSAGLRLEQVVEDAAGPIALTAQP